MGLPYWSARIPHFAAPGAVAFVATTAVVLWRRRQTDAALGARAVALGAGAFLGSVLPGGLIAAALGRWW